MMTPLDHKLLRDLWRLKGQTIAITLVMAVGVMMLVMMDGLVNSLDETKQAYYQRYRLTDLFAPAKSIPAPVVDKIKALPGVAAVTPRIRGSALLDLIEIATPIHAQAVSLPDFGNPTLNDLYLSAGRKINPDKRDEIILLQGFATAHQLEPGDLLSATLHGKKRQLKIVGLAQSPEFLYAASPGELVPDDSRFAVIWMSETALAAAYDLEGAYNELLLSLESGVRTAAVIAPLDRMLDRYGGLGSYSIADNISNRFITEEIDGLKVTSKVVPPIFLMVAAFLLYIVISRMVDAEREQIGLIKSFGYSHWQVGRHYFKFILAIAIAGALLGSLMGIIAGQQLSKVYQFYYKLPFLLFELDPRTYIIGLFVSISTASLGGIFILRKIFHLTPAEAMRPPVPQDYSRTVNFRGIWRKIFDQPSRMVFRALFRQPFKAAASVIGIASGMALSVSMLTTMSGFDQTLELNYSVIDRSDVSVTFVEPLADGIRFDLLNIKGVQQVEPFREVSTVFRNGVYSYRGSLTGLEDTPLLYRAVDNNAQPIALLADGVTLSASLAKVLQIQVGDSLSIELREGQQTKTEIPVVQIANTLLGAPAYLQKETLNTLLKEPHRSSGVYLQIDPAYREQIYRELKDIPAIAGVSLRSDTRAAFQRLMDSGAGAMRYIMAIIAGVITFGIVYNSARITFSERSRDLASLRVIGLTRGETAFILLGELAIIILLALPLGGYMGHFLSQAVSAGFSTEIYQIPADFHPVSYGQAVIAVLLAALLSGVIIMRDINRLDLVAALKTRE